MFEAAGLGPLEEDVYGLLLEHHGLLLDDLAGTRTEPAAVLATALERLEAVGLVTRSPGSDSPRYIPAPPDLAIEALVLRRHGELEQLRAHATALARRYWAAVQRSDHGALVEVVRGSDAVHQHAMQAQRAARRAVLLIDRPPYVGGTPSVNDEELSGLSRGVSYRCVYDIATLDIDHQAKLMFRYVEAGEQARTLPDIPLKMLVVDEEIAIVPLVLDDVEYRDCAIVRGSTLISALVTCFEAFWARAVPVTSTTAAASVDPARMVAPGDDRPTPLELRVVALLAAGVKDDAIARQLDVSTRTVNRYMAGSFRRYQGAGGALPARRDGVDAPCRDRERLPRETSLRRAGRSSADCTTRRDDSPRFPAAANVAGYGRWVKGASAACGPLTRRPWPASSRSRGTETHECARTHRGRDGRFGGFSAQWVTCRGSLLRSRA